MIQYKMHDFTSKEILEATRIQIRELPTGFLSSLGEKPLSLIFQHAAESKFGILIMAKHGDKVVGYVMGTLDTGKFYKEFLRKRLLVAIRYFLPRILSLQRARKALETLLYPSKHSHRGVYTKTELLDLAVMREYQGQGIASQLFRLLVKEFHANNVRCFQIPTSEGLDRAHRFYEKMGAHRVSTLEVHKGERTFVYLYEISEGECHERTTSRKA